MNRRDALRAMFIVLGSTRASAAAPAVSTLIGTGSPGYSDREVNNPYGVTIGPDRGLYFCDLDNQRIRRLDLKTRRTTTIAGDGQKAYRGDGGPAVDASLNMPHEIQFDSAGHLYIAERDNHVVREVDARTSVISTVAGTGAPRILRGRRSGRNGRSCVSLTALPSIPRADSLSAMSETTVFDGWTCRAAPSRPTQVRANGSRLRMALH